MPNGTGSPSRAASLEAMDEEASATLGNAPVQRSVEPCGHAETLMIRIAIKGEDGIPVPGVPYSLEVGDEVWERKTDENGLVEQEVPAESTKGLLKVWRDGDPSGEPEVIELALAEMDPLEMQTGQEARLANLGFAGFADDEEEPVSPEESFFYFRLWAGLDEEATLETDGVGALGTFYDPQGKEEAYDAFGELDEDEGDEGEDEEDPDEENEG